MKTCKLHLSMISASLFLCPLSTASEPAEEHIYKNTTDRPLKIYLTYPEIGPTHIIYKEKDDIGSSGF